MPVLDSVRGLLLHLGEHVADDTGWVVGRPGGAGGVDRNVGERRPRERVVEVVLEEVVLRQVGQVRLLHVRDIGRAQGADVHLEGLEVGGCRR